MFEVRWKWEVRVKDFQGMISGPFLGRKWRILGYRGIGIS